MFLMLYVLAAFHFLILVFSRFYFLHFYNDHREHWLHCCLVFSFSSSAFF